MASRQFAPVRERGADVMTSVRQVSSLYNWLQELIREARERGEGDPLSEEEAEMMRNDLIKGIKGAETQSGGEGDEGEDGDGGGEPDQNVQMDVSGKQSKGGKGRALSPEELRKLIEQGAEIKPSQGEGSADGDGMYLTQLTGKQLSELEQMREQLGEVGSVTGQGRLMIGRGRQDSYYAYDEWDYVLNDYRRNWCRLREIPVAGDEGDFFENTLMRYAEMLPGVRRNFQRIRPGNVPDGPRTGGRRGNRPRSTIEARVARLMGETPDGRVYKARKEEARDVATLFLLDMWASTDEPFHHEPREPDDDDTDDG